MNEQFVQVGPTRLCYEVLGETGPTVVLVMGLNLQMLWWRDDFCRGLVERGLRVLRFDNRDVGRSSTFPDTRVTAWQFLTRFGVRPTYGLDDMADDTAGLIHQVAPGGAHLVGASLGAFVAQQTAIRHPAAVLSLTSVMGRPGDGTSGKVAWRMRPRFLSPAPDDVEARAEHMVRTFRKIGSLHRTEDLRAVRVPALVVHGERDRVVLPSGGRATAAAIPGAELLAVPGMGHDLPRWVWPQLQDAIVRTVHRAADQVRT